MLDATTQNTLNALKLFGMAHGLPARLADPRQAELSHAEFVGLLVQDEKTYRDDKRLRRLLKNAKLKQPACLEDIDYRQSRGLSKQLMLELANPAWIASGRNVLLSGPTGVGKSYIACALGNLAARTGHPVLYVRASRLFDTLQQARGDGSHLRVLQRLGRAQMLVIDDFLLAPLTEAARMDFLDLIEDRCGSGSTIVTSQCPIKEWHQNIGDPTIADAVCDRLLHGAYKIELRGESMRRRQR